MPRLRLQIVTAIGFVTLIATTLLFAQENTPSGQKKAEPLPKAAPADPKRLPGESNPSTTLYLVLLTGPDEFSDDIVMNVKKALTYTRATYAGEPKIKAVSPTFFEEFADLIDQASTVGAAAEDVLGVKRLSSREVVYELTIDPSQILKKLEVTYKSGKKEEYEPAGPGEKSALTLIVPGKYAFTPLVGDTPKTYGVTVGEFGKKDATKTANWPITSKYFVLTLKNFVGNKDALFAALGNPGVVANPFKVKRGDDLQFAFASLNSTAAEIDEDPIGIDGIRLTAENLPNSVVRRVWCYFPLDEEGVKKAIEEFRKDGLRSVSMSKEIRKNSDPATNAKATINDSDAPKWYELATAPAAEAGPRVGFVRELRVDNLRKLYDRYKTLYKFMVWEFDNGTAAPEAIAIQHPKTEIGRVYAIERELQGWRRKAEAAMKKETDKEKK